MVNSKNAYCYFCIFFLKIIFHFHFLFVVSNQNICFNRLYQPCQVKIHLLNCFHSINSIARKKLRLLPNTWNAFMVLLNLLSIRKHTTKSWRNTPSSINMPCLNSKHAHQLKSLQRNTNCIYYFSIGLPLFRHFVHIYRCYREKFQDLIRVWVQFRAALKTVSVIVSIINILHCFID